MTEQKSCTCKECQDMCRIPCWPTPDEAVALIDAGYGARMMADYWVRTDRGDTLVLAPATPGREGGFAPFMSNGCVFQGKDGLCELHDPGLKPIEGRLSFACVGEASLSRESVMEMWDTSEGQELATKWMEQNYD